MRHFVICQLKLCSFLLYYGGVLSSNNSFVLIFYKKIYFSVVLVICGQRDKIKFWVIYLLSQ